MIHSKEDNSCVICEGLKAVITDVMEISDEFQLIIYNRGHNCLDTDADTQMYITTVWKPTSRK